LSKAIELRRPLRGLSLEYYGESPILPEVAETRAKEAHARGKNEAEAFYNSQIAELRQDMSELQAGLFQSLENSIGQLEEVVNTRLPALVIELMRRVCAGYAPPAEAIKAIVEEAVAEASPDGAECEVLLCPQDIEKLKENGSLDTFKRIRFTPEASLNAGDCMVQSRFGLVDARQATKIRQIEEEFGEGLA